MSTDNLGVFNLQNYRLIYLNDLQAGDHLNYMYKTEEEHKAFFTSFLHTGLDRNEKIIYAVDVHSENDILDYLREEGLKEAIYLSSGQLKFINTKELFINDGIIDIDQMVSFLKSETENALSEGYNALRFTSEMSWAAHEYGFHC